VKKLFLQWKQQTFSTTLFWGIAFAPLKGSKHKKILDSYKYFICGFVNCFESKTYGQKIVTVAKVRVISSCAAFMTCYGLGEEQMILLSYLPSGWMVESAYCICMAGLGEVCSHVEQFCFI